LASVGEELPSIGNSGACLQIFKWESTVRAVYCGLPMGSRGDELGKQRSAQFPEEYPQKEAVAGQAAVFTVTLKERSEKNCRN